MRDLTNVAWVVLRVAAVIIADALFDAELVVTTFRSRSHNCQM